MMLGKKIALSYDDITIIPEKITTIESRSECNILTDTFCGYGDVDNKGYPMLPIITSPMDTVVDEHNFHLYLNEGIIPVLPRTIKLEKRCFLGYNHNVFVALSLQEAIDIFINETTLLQEEHFENDEFYLPNKICIDMANGHMQKLINIIKIIKEMYGDDVEVMAGNIANPEAYELYEEVGCDYIRVGIGGGSACTTSSNTSIHYPYFSLLEEIWKIKTYNNGKCKVIADGNIRGYRDIQKALVFADYVMIGGLFNQTIESAAKTTYGKFYWNIRGRKIVRPLKTLLNYGKEVNQYDDKIKKKWKEGKFVLWKQYYGMSTKIAQKKINDTSKNVKLKTSEGLSKYQKVEYTLSGWIENERDYLRSALSYTNSRNLEEYKNSDYCVILNRRFND